MAAWRSMDDEAYDRAESYAIHVGDNVYDFSVDDPVRAGDETGDDRPATEEAAA